MYCPFCGYELPDDAKFCQSCGRRVPDYNKIESQTDSQPIERGEIVDTVPVNITDSRTETTLQTEINNTEFPGTEQIPIETTTTPQTDIPKESDLSSQIEVQKKKDSNLGTRIIIAGVIIFIFIFILPFPSMWGEDSSNEIERVSVLVSSNPSGADVYIGGKYHGSTPLTLELMPNTGYMIVIKKDGYDQWAKSINPGDGSNPTTVYASLTPASVYSPTYTPPPTPTYTPTYQTSDTIDKQYVWDYGGYTWTTDIPISRSTYLKYKSLDRQRYNFWEYVSNAENRALVRDVADSIVEAGLECGFTKDDCVRMAVSFVQSIPYKTDRDSTGLDEYYKYPIETLVDGCGDCEDSAILTASIVREMGYGVVLLLFDNHMAVGIKGSDSMYGTYWTYGGEKYFYLETTAEGWDVGDIPSEYKNKMATVIPFI